MASSRARSARLRSLTSRTKACQRPSDSSFALTSTGNPPPSLRHAVHSKMPDTPRCEISSAASATRTASAGDINASIGLPSSSSRTYPNMSQAARLTSMIRLAGSVMKMPSEACSKTSCARASAARDISAARRASSARLRSVTSTTCAIW